MNRYAAAFYRAVPAWGQNLLLTGFGLALARERYGGRYGDYRRLFERLDRASLSELQAYQDERLREIVAHAFLSVPFYRERWQALGLTPADIRGQADLWKLPLLTKDDVRHHYGELRSSEVPARAMRTGHTSGTTGTPLTVGYDRETVWATYAVFDRHYAWADLRMGARGDRIAVARGNVIVPLQQASPPFWRYNRAQNQLLLSSFHLSRQNLPAYVEALKAFAPDVIDGYPSTLYVLARFLEATGDTLPVRAAVTSSETLYDFQRELIERRFACRVFDYYALAERTVFAGECDRHEGHHVAMDYGLAEIVDNSGAPVPAGTAGRLVGTSLHNKAMPLIRYATSDITTLRSEPCSCGRGHVMMDEVATKAEDMLTLPDGRLISPSVLTHPFKPLDCIEGSQIVQTSPDAVEVRLVAGDGFSDNLSRDLRDALAERLGQGVRIDIRLVDRLETSRNGKFKWVISHVPPGI